MQPIALDEVIAAVRPGVERLNVGQFHRMIETGILREGESIELIDGILVRKDNSDKGGDPMTHGPKHAFCIQRVRGLEERLRRNPVHLRQQLPITLSDDREPEPDVAIVRGTIEDYVSSHPGAADCLLVIEVADSSLEYDRTVKKSIYATASIPFYLIVNIPERQLEIYEEADREASRYLRQNVAKAGEQISLELEAGVLLEFETGEILP